MTDLKIGDERFREGSPVRRHTTVSVIIPLQENSIDALPRRFLYSQRLVQKLDASTQRRDIDNANSISENRSSDFKRPCLS